MLLYHSYQNLGFWGKPFQYLINPLIYVCNPVIICAKVFCFLLFFWLRQTHFQNYLSHKIMFGIFTQRDTFETSCILKVGLFEMTTWCYCYTMKTESLTYFFLSSPGNKSSLSEKANLNNWLIYSNFPFFVLFIWHVINSFPGNRYSVLSVQVQ